MILICVFFFLFIYEFLKFQMKKFNSTFNKEMLEFAINNFIKNINFAINKIKIIKIVFNQLFIFIITINKYNNVIFFNYEQATFFVYNIINNQIKINYIRFIKHMNLNINHYKNFINFIKFYEKKLNKFFF